MDWFISILQRWVVILFDHYKIIDLSTFYVAVYCSYYPYRFRLFHSWLKEPLWVGSWTLDTTLAVFESLVLSCSWLSFSIPCCRCGDSQMSKELRYLFLTAMMFFTQLSFIVLFWNHFYKKECNFSATYPNVERWKNILKGIGIKNL